MPSGKDNEILMQVSNMIKMDSDNGKKLWKDINDDGLYCYTGDDIRDWKKTH